jgi:hypothetical protein
MSNLMILKMRMTSNAVSVHVDSDTTLVTCVVMCWQGLSIAACQQPETGQYKCVMNAQQ